jgi:hypothetical protein
MKTVWSSRVLLLAALVVAASCQYPAPASSPAASIRATDFRNFRYPFQGTAWTLIDGEERGAGDDEDPEWRYEFSNVSYGDLTGDGREEAVVTITAETGGTMVPHWVFVYAAGPRDPELLWSFETGDRTQGGLKGVSVDEGTLVVELFGKNMVPSDPETFGAEDDTAQGACCPSVFTRTRYAWTGRAFVLHGAPEVLPYDPEAA